MENVLSETKAVDILSASDLRRVLNQLEGSATKNAEQRLRHPDSPERFLDSEVNLDQNLRSLSAISTNPQLYPALIKFGGINQLTALLAHDNLDIVAAVIILLNELIEPDVIDDHLNNVKALVDTMVEQEVFGAVVDCMKSRLGLEAFKEDTIAKALYQGLAMFENAVELDIKYSSMLVKKTEIMDYCCELIKTVEGFDGSKAYAIELLAIFLQSSIDNVKRGTALDVVNIVIDALGPYRKIPRKLEGGKVKSATGASEDENEMVQCLFDILCTILLTEGNTSFLRAEGLELMIRFVKNRKVFRDSAVKVISFACTNSKEAVVKIFDIGGVGVIFSYFLQMEKGQKPARRRKSEEQVQENVEHCLSIIYEMFRFADKQGIQRLIVKFWENEGRKTLHLLNIYYEYSNLLAESNPRLDLERDQPEEMSTQMFVTQSAALLIGKLLSNGPERICAGIMNAMDELDIEMGDIIDKIGRYASRIQEGKGEYVQQTRKEVEQLQNLIDDMKNISKKAGSAQDVSKPAT